MTGLNTGRGKAAGKTADMAVVKSVDMATGKAAGAAVDGSNGIDREIYD